MPQPKHTEEVEAPIQGPAKESERHVWNRPATDDHMRPILGKNACSVVSSLVLALDRGQLRGGSPNYSEKDRFNAGEYYGMLVKVSQKGGRDSTQALNVSRSTTLGSNNDLQERAWDSLLAIGSYMSPANRKIVDMVCGDDATPAEAVRSACGGDFKHTVPAKLRDALDSLIEAIKMAEKYPGRFNMRRVG
jgi:hypothetical protein